jgi:DNA polymerase
VILYADTETFSETPIRDGTRRYAEDVEVMLTSWAIDDGPVHVTDHMAGEQGPFELFDIDDFEWIVFHNSDFDRIVIAEGQSVVIPVEKIWDTAMQARAHGLPGGLDKLCKIFRVPEALAKHQDGKSFINLFCKPRPKNVKLRRATRDTHPIEWQRFMDYAGGDVHAMRYLKRVLPKWNYPTREHGLWCLDQRINDRGFQVDLDLARAAIALIADMKADADAKVQDITDGTVRSASQRDEMLKELMLEYGISLPDFTASTIERRLEDPDLPPPAKELLRQRLLVSTTSTAKYKAMVKAVSSDGRLRGSMVFCGAARTKRDSGKTFQPQNLPRPDMDADQIEREINWLKLGFEDRIIEPHRFGWNALRGLIVAAPGKKLVQADLSGIEARVLPWLAGEDWKLQVWRDKDAGTGPDVYRATAGRLLGKDPADVDGKERQSHGKVVELACGYGGAAGAFAQFAALYGVDMAEHEVMAAVRGWREAHPAIADWDDGLWARLDRAAREATLNPGRIVQAGPYIAFERWKNWLKMHLPSGGFLSYADPKIVADPRRRGSDTLSFMGINNYTRKFERITTYGGKLSADATQSTAREIFVGNWQRIEDAGFPIVLRVHDEVLTEPEDDPAYGVERLTKLLAHRHDWIDDKLPLAAGGFEAYRYKKDD